MNKERTDLQAAVNEALIALTENGTMGELSQKWVGEDNFATAEALGLR